MGSALEASKSIRDLTAAIVSSFMGFGQFAAVTQFFLYGRRHFTANGWKRASAKYADTLAMDDVNLTGKHYVVTGANSGCGLELSRFLARRGATLYMVCRSKYRADAAREEVSASSGNPNVHTLIADVALAADIRAVSKAIAAVAPAIDGLVCNAGALSAERTCTREGVEITFACHLLNGAYLLSQELLPLLKRSTSPRVIFVSSGGMYATPFPGWDVASSSDSPASYDGQLAYAYAKRAQVLLAERLDAEHAKVRFVSCHPGWVDTPGVEHAYGAGRIALRPMRSLWQGTEGIAWLCSAKLEEIEGGAFYLDRTPQVKHLAGPFFTEGSFTKNSREEVDELIARCRAATLPAEVSPTTSEVMQNDVN